MTVCLSIHTYKLP